MREEEGGREGKREGGREGGREGRRERSGVLHVNAKFNIEANYFFKFVIVNFSISIEIKHLEGYLEMLHWS